MQRHYIQEMHIGCLFSNRVALNTELQTAFYIGQVVLCHVIDCNPEKSRISLSFKVNFFVTLSIDFSYFLYWLFFLLSPSFYNHGSCHTQVHVHKSIIIISVFYFCTVKSSTLECVRIAFEKGLNEEEVKK